VARHHCWDADPLGLGLSLSIYVPPLYAIYQALHYSTWYQRVRASSHPTAATSSLPKSSRHRLPRRRPGRLTHPSRGDPSPQPVASLWPPPPPTGRHGPPPAASIPFFGQRLPPPPAGELGLKRAPTSRPASPPSPAPAPPRLCYCSGRRLLLLDVGWRRRRPRRTPSLVRIPPAPPLLPGPPSCQGRPRQIFRRRLLLLRPPPPPSPPRRPCRRLSSPGLTRPRRSASTRPCCAPIRHAHHWGPPSAAPAADAPIRRARHRQWRDASPRSVASHDCAPPAARPPAPLSSSASPWRGHLPPPAATNLRAPPLRLRWRNSDPLLDGSNIPDLTLPGPSSPASHSSAIAPPLPYPLMRYKTIAKLLARCV
jgi:hypothetical protein